MQELVSLSLPSPRDSPTSNDNFDSGVWCFLSMHGCFVTGALGRWRRQAHLVFLFSLGGLFWPIWLSSAMNFFHFCLAPSGSAKGDASPSVNSGRSWRLSDPGSGTTHCLLCGLSLYASQTQPVAAPSQPKWSLSNSLLVISAQCEPCNVSMAVALWRKTHLDLLLFL